MYLRMHIIYILYKQYKYMYQYHLFKNFPTGHISMAFLNLCNLLSTAFPMLKKMLMERYKLGSKVLFITILEEQTTL